MADALSPRVDEAGCAFSGSQLQVQLYIAKRTGALSRAVLGTLEIPSDEARIEWVAPLKKRRFVEPMDEAFLDALGLTFHVPELASFWPKSGPRWDALGILRHPDRSDGYLLVEGKSYLEEVYGSGCQAVDPESVERIMSSLHSARQWFSVSQDSDWLGRLYQYGNRLAHVYFLRERLGKEAILVNLYFLDDVTRPYPTSRESRESGLKVIKRELGFTTDTVPHSIDVFLNAGKREDLVNPAT